VEYVLSYRLKGSNDKITSADLLKREHVTIIAAHKFGN